MAFHIYLGCNRLHHIIHSVTVLL